MISFNVAKCVTGSNTRTVQQVTASGSVSSCEEPAVSGVPQLH